MMGRLFLASVLVACCLTSETIATETIGGFDVSESSIPVAEILPGGPPKDGIPALDNPHLVAAADAAFLSDDDVVLGVALSGEARAYPISILNWHEIVNDKIGSRPILVTYCPLCGTGMVFAAPNTLSFGVSGLLYKSDVLMYDRQSESLWSQLLMKSISGKYRGQKLTLLAASHTTWKDWRSRYPETRVLSTRTGFQRDYSRDPYAGYNTSRKLFFPVSGRNGRYHPKEQVIGVRMGGKSWAWPFSELSKSAGIVRAELGDEKVEIRFNSEARSGGVFNANGKEIPSTIAYWFAWIDFYPESQIYEAP